MATVKHIIFTGRERTGKSLFANIIFDRSKTLWVKGNEMTYDNYFLFDTTREKWDYEYVIIDNLKASFDIEVFYNFLFANELCINRRNIGKVYVKMPKIIFIFDAGVTVNQDLATFNRRFTVLDFDKNTIADLTKLIEEENIIINIHR